MSEKKFHSGFTRIPVNENGGKAIKTLQEDFDRFWRKINRLSDKRTEKYYALKAMQEACMWMTRAVALQNEKQSDLIIDDPIIRENVHQKTLGEMLDKYNKGDRIEIKNRPNIIIKKK